MSGRVPPSGFKPGPRPEIKRQDTEYVENELTNVCEVIEVYGKPVKASEEGLATIRFGDLFKHHSVVSNRLLGVLLKARKLGYINFKGELLLQNKDEDEPITLIKMPPTSVQVTKNKIFKVPSVEKSGSTK